MTKSALPCDELLLQRLEKITAEHIDALIDVLTDFGRGRASLDAEVKKTLVMARHDPRPARYREKHLKLVVHELQHFGGHSVANLVRRLRDQPPVSYETIVNDVHKKLNGTSTDEKTIEVKECEIARALFGDPASASTLAQRIERSTSAKVMTGFFTIESSSLMQKFATAGGVGGLLASAPKLLPSAGKLGLRLNPLAAIASTATFVAHTASAEAYRITIPFVAEMGWIGLQPACRASKQQSDKTVLTAAEAKARRGKAPSEEGGIVLTNEQGGTLMRFTTFESDIPELRGRTVPGNAVSALNPLLSNVPGVAALAEQQRGNYVLCSIPFDALVDSVGGPDGSKRAFVMGAKGIENHAYISTPEALQNVLVSGAAWNALSSAVGQKHLHDINEKLTDIKKQLDELSDSVKDLRIEKLEGLMAYVQDLLDHQASEGITSRALDQLEGSLPELTGLESFFRKEMKKELDKARDLETGKWLGAGTVRTEIEGSVDRMNRWIQGYLQVSQLQIVSLWLLHKEQPLARYSASAAAVLERTQQLDEVVLNSRQIYPAQMSMSSSMAAVAPDQTGAFELKVQSLCQNTDTGRADTQGWYERLFEQAECQMLLRIEEGGIQEARFVD